MELTAKEIADLASQAGFLVKAPPLKGEDLAFMLNTKFDIKQRGDGLPWEIELTTGGTGKYKTIALSNDSGFEEIFPLGNNL